VLNLMFESMLNTLLGHSGHLSQCKHPVLARLTIEPTWFVRCKIGLLLIQDLYSERLSYMALSIKSSRSSPIRPLFLGLGLILWEY